jgi:MFS family permease
MSTPSSASTLAVVIGVVQFFFVTTWTVYVIYLPGLLEQAGIAKTWVPWILLADQAVFAVVDVATGFWCDRVRKGLARFGGWVLAASVVSGAAFLLMPFAGGQPAVLLGAILVWAVTSSALRAPPWALLGKHAAKPSLPWLSTLVLTGTALASAAAPYLGMALKGVDARLPFAVSTLVLLATVAILVLAERRFVPVAPQEPEKPVGEKPVLVFAAILLLAVSMQVYFFLSAAPAYLRFAPAAQLPWLMPVFWIGFNLLMFPASLLVKRIGTTPVLSVAAVLGAVAMVLTPLAGSLNLLVAVQFLAGGCWGAASVAAYTSAVDFGRTGREGHFLGTLFAVLAGAAFARIGAGASGLVALPEFKVIQPWLPSVGWALAAVLFLAIAGASRARR